MWLKLITWLITPMWIKEFAFSSLVFLRKKDNIIATDGGKALQTVSHSWLTDC